nr:hypothetical protein GCM10025732_13600 [Glycomyces mayteni]
MFFTLTVMHPRHTDPDDARHERRVIVVGDNGLTLRFIRNLVDNFAFHVVAVIPSGPGGQREEIRRAAEHNHRLTIREARNVDADVIRDAGLTDAYAVALMDQNDVGNLHLALKLREMSRYLNDDTLPRLVIRMYNSGLRAHMQKLLGDDGVFVKSDADMVARTYAAAALEQIPPGDIVIWERRLYLARAGDPRAQAQWVVATGNEFGVDMIPRTPTGPRTPTRRCGCCAWSRSPRGGGSVRCGSGCGSGSGSRCTRCGARSPRACGWPRPSSWR